MCGWVGGGKIGSGVCVYVCWGGGGGVITCVSARFLL